MIWFKLPKPWENHRKTIGKWWFVMGFFMGFNGDYPLVMTNIAMV